MQKSLYLLVFAIVLLSGCTNGETKVQNTDLLRISYLTVTPGAVVSPGEDVTVRMKIENVGQEEALLETKPEKVPSRIRRTPIP